MSKRLLPTRPIPPTYLGALVRWWDLQYMAARDTVHNLYGCTAALVEDMYVREGRVHMWIGYLHSATAVTSAEDRQPTYIIRRRLITSRRVLASGRTRGAPSLSVPLVGTCIYNRSTCWLKPRDWFAVDEGGLQHGALLLLPRPRSGCRNLLFSPLLQSSPPLCQYQSRSHGADPA